VLFTPGFSQVQPKGETNGNRLNGFQCPAMYSITWLKPGVNEKIDVRRTS